MAGEDRKEHEVRKVVTGRRRKKKVQGAPRHCEDTGFYFEQNAKPPEGFELKA